MREAKILDVDTLRKGLNVLKELCGLEVGRSRYDSVYAWPDYRIIRPSGPSRLPNESAPRLPNQSAISYVERYPLNETGVCVSPQSREAPSETPALPPGHTQVSGAGEEPAGCQPASQTKLFDCQAFRWMCVNLGERRRQELRELVTEALESSNGGKVVRCWFARVEKERGGWLARKADPLGYAAKCLANEAEAVEAETAREEGRKHSEEVRMQEERRQDEECANRRKEEAEEDVRMQAQFHALPPAEQAALIEHGLAHPLPLKRADPTKPTEGLLWIRLRRALLQSATERAAL